jgi:prepilin-type processing-associated H-X9-DG protein
MKRQSTRYGLTIVELLVVIAIMTIMAGLILSAVTQARESARHIACQSNMRQNGIAVMSFIGAKSFYPPGYEFYIDADRSKGNRGAVVNGFFTLILPYLGDKALEQRYDYQQGYDHQINQSVVKTKVPTFLCPSTPGDRTMKIRNNLAGYAGGRPDQGHVGEATDYFGVRVFVDSNTQRYKGVFRAIFPLLPGFEPEQPLNESQITDGLSHTLMMVEIAGRPNRYAQQLRPLGKPDYYAGTWAGVNGEMVYAIDPTITIAPVPGDCVINCNNFYTPYSFHPKGVNTLYCDGSVHRLAETIDQETWRQIVQPDDGQLQSQSLE